MAKEIEIKRIFTPSAEQLVIIKAIAFAEIKVEQGYLAIDTSSEVRIRCQAIDGKVAYLVAVKRGDGLVRDEVEFPITAEIFAALWPLTVGRRVEKTRYQIHLENNLVAEVDIYHGTLAKHASLEVELPNEQAASTLVLPEFFGETQDVTCDKRYKNQSLATQGWPAEEQAN